MYLDTNTAVICVVYYDILRMCKPGIYTAEETHVTRTVLFQGSITALTPSQAKKEEKINK